MGNEFTREDIYEALYTKDKTRKKEVDRRDRKSKCCILSSSKSTKVVVYDEEGTRQITHSFCKLQPPGFVIEDDYEFETEKFIVQILNIKTDKVGSMLPENTSMNVRNISTPTRKSPLCSKLCHTKEAGKSLQAAHRKNFIEH